MAAERAEGTDRAERAERAERGERARTNTPEVTCGSFPGPLDHVGPFEVRGVVGARAPGATKVTVTAGWKDGEVYGDEAAVVLIRMASRVYDGALVGPPSGPFTETAEDHLGSPASAYQLMKQVLSRVSVVKGEAPAPRFYGGQIP